MVVVEKLVVEETCKLSVGDQDALKSRVLKLCQTVFSCTFIYDAGHDPNRLAIFCTQSCVNTNTIPTPRPWRKTSLPAKRALRP